MKFRQQIHTQPAHSARIVWVICSRLFRNSRRGRNYFSALLGGCLSVSLNRLYAKNIPRWIYEMRFVQAHTHTRTKQTAVSHNIAYWASAPCHCIHMVAVYSKQHQQQQQQRQSKATVIPTSIRELVQWKCISMDSDLAQKHLIIIFLSHADSMWNLWRVMGPNGRCNTSWLLFALCASKVKGFIIGISYIYKCSASQGVKRATERVREWER